MNDKKIKVLQLPSWYPPEGGAFCLEQSVELKKLGIDVQILANVTLPWKKYGFKLLSYPFRSFSTIENIIDVYKYYSWRIPFLHMQNIDKWINQTVKLFDTYIKKHQAPDFIHAHSIMWAGVAAARIKEKYGIPYILTEHWSAFSEKSGWSKSLLERYDHLIKEGFSTPSYVITVSDEIQPAVAKYKPKEVQMTTISNIVDTVFFYPPSERPVNSCFKFVCLNSYCPEKGYDILLSAIDILHKQNLKFEINIAGGRFNNKEYQNFLANCKGKEHITHIGFLNRREVREALWTADAFLLPSRDESQSIATLEALATGLPVVCTDVVPKAVCKDFCGYHVPIENPEALAQAMIDMINNRKNFDEQQIRNHVESIAAPQVVASKIIEVYKEVLS